MKKMPLLSIAISAFNRPNELKFCLERFISQIIGKYEENIEIIISDDHSPNDCLHEIRSIADCYNFLKYRRYPQNIGLERNLLACAEGCKGKFLWLFGDDDYLESDDALDQIMQLLQEGRYDFYVYNRTRRSFDLSKILTDNWMKINAEKSIEFSGLREFCKTYGFISIIGFISVNIFRRDFYQQVAAEKYLGTMYPQLGAMVEAFHNRPTLLVGRPLICHRTQTSEEKKAALGAKLSETDFMADVQRRNAIYFSHPYVSMLDELIKLGAFTPADIVDIPENTVINGLLIDFLIQTVTLNHQMFTATSSGTWERTANFFRMLPLDIDRRQRIETVLSAHTGPIAERIAIMMPSASDRYKQNLTISVISPSYNQAEFLGECLASVRDQTYKPIEHLVYDPGSHDDSRAIALSFSHVTLIAESDEGQSDALNKGFLRARGDIIAWLNSDDCFAGPHVFERVVQRFLEPDRPDIVYGKGFYINEFGKKLRDVYVNKDPATFPWRFHHEDGILQPALFMRRSVIERIGQLRNDLHYSMDYEYWIRCVKNSIKFAYIDENFAIARYHSNNKTYGMRGNSYLEVFDIMKEHFGYVNHIWLKRYAEFLAEGHDGVLVNSNNSGMADPLKFSILYRELLIAYNTNYDTYRLLVNRGLQKGHGDTLREMKKLDIVPTVLCKEIPIEKENEAGYISYTVGPRRWAFDSNWKRTEIEKSHRFLREQMAKRRRDTCIIVGNGPSLNKTDLSLLEGQDVIVSNNIFLSKDIMKKATYYTTVNFLVAEQSCHHINLIKHTHKILPYWLAYCLSPGPNTYFVDAVGHPEFSKDMFKNMSWRHTVTFFNLHLAYGLGYRKVIMIGFDHNYTQPKDVVEQEVIHSYESDVNHFHSDYFRGKKWQAADVDMMEEMYRLAKTAYEEDDREIVNCTVGGKLELFRRGDLATELGLNSRVTVPQQLAFSRDEKAHYDETDCIAKLFYKSLTGKNMIDVGAHHGGALEPFLNYGWKILAFEPDSHNRQKLLEKLAKHKNADLVSLDSRAVSNESKQGLAFYRSEESTGISGLSAFHSSHQEAQQVDTVTLSEALADKELGSVDFLKIDTEGHDLFVLQGFPWDRFKPAVIECEFEDSKTVPLGYTFHDLAKYLVDRGYSVYVSEWHPIIRYGIRHDWHRLMRYPCELADSKAWGNLLAFRDPIDEAELVKVVHQVLKFGTPKLAAAPNPANIAAATQAQPAPAPAPAATPKVLPSISGRPARPRHVNRDTLVVVGNGPSLRGFDFTRLNGIATVGMNAAYRYWYQIGWYPTYYMCLDTVVTESHKAEIHRLIQDSENNGIQLFLVRRTLVNSFPHLSQNPKVIVFDDYLESKYFAGIQLTTGSIAPLFAAMLGYRKVYLLGIDLNYVQQLPEARKVNGQVLEIKQTPQKNPNYFFNGYQQQGDRYNIPDSLPDLHYQSWVAARRRLDELGVDVVNGNPRSRVDLFDRVSIDTLLPWSA